MPRKSFTPEQVIAKLRHIEVALANGKTLPQACKEATISSQLRDELLNGEIFYSLKEARIVIESWRRHYNTKRPHSSLGYRPPAPVARGRTNSTIEPSVLMQ